MSWTAAWAAADAGKGQSIRIDPESAGTVAQNVAGIGQSVRSATPLPLHGTVYVEIMFERAGRKTGDPLGGFYMLGLLMTEAATQRTKSFGEVNGLANMRDAFFGVDDCGAPDNNYTGVRSGRGGLQGAPESSRAAPGGRVFLCGDRVGLLCDMDRRMLAFFRNGIHIPGLLFLNLPGGEFYVATTLVHPGACVRIGTAPAPPLAPLDTLISIAPTSRPGSAAGASRPPPTTGPPLHCLASPHTAALPGVSASGEPHPGSHASSQVGSPISTPFQYRPAHLTAPPAQGLPPPHAAPHPTQPRPLGRVPVKMPLVQLPALLSPHARPLLDRALAKRQKSAAEVEMDLFLEQARRERRARMALASLGVEPTPAAISASVEKEQLQEAACVAYLLARLHQERRIEQQAAHTGPTDSGGVGAGGASGVNGGACSSSPRLKAVTLPLIKWTLRCEIPGHVNDPLVCIADVRAPDGTPWEVNTADDIHALTRANGHCDIQRILAADEMGIDTGTTAPPPRSGLYLTTSEHPVLGHGRRNFDFFARVALGRPETASRYLEVVLAHAARSATEAATHDPMRIIARWTPLTGVVTGPAAVPAGTAAAAARAPAEVAQAAADSMRDRQLSPPHHHCEQHETSRHAREGGGETAASGDGDGGTRNSAPGPEASGGILSGMPFSSGRDGGATCQVFTKIDEG